MSLSGWSASNFIRCPSALVPAVHPVSMCCWFNTTTVGSSQHMVGVYNSAGATDRNSHYLKIDTISSGILAAVSCDGSASSQASSAAVAINQWNHAGGVFNTATDRRVFYNGTKSTNSTSRTPSSLNRASIGLQDNAAGNRAFSGFLAEVGIWDVALDDAEMASLAAGVSPLKIRPQNLLAYLPVINGALDYKGNAFAIQGSLTSADHTRMLGIT